MNNDIDFIKACCEIADGWEIIKEMLTDERDFSYFSTYIKAPNRTSIDVDDIKKDLIYFPLLISQTADKLEITINANYGKKTWEWFKIDERIELIEDGKSYETANEARMAGIKAMMDS